MSTYSDTTRLPFQKKHLVTRLPSYNDENSINEGALGEIDFKEDKIIEPGLILLKSEKKALIVHTQKKFNPKNYDVNSLIDKFLSEFKTEKGGSKIYINMEDLEEKYKKGILLEDAGELDKKQLPKLYEEIQLRHPHVTKGKRIQKISCCINTGFFCCCDRCRTPSELEDLGIGMVVYFKFLKSLILCFLLIALFNIPLILTYMSSNSDHKAINYLDILFKTTIGNIGSSLFNCQKFDLSVLNDNNFEIELDCKENVLIGAKSFSVAKDSTTEISNNANCNLFMTKEDLTFDASECDLTSYINEVIKDSNCIKQHTCHLTLNLQNQTCKHSNEISNVYFTYTCFKDTINFAFLNTNIKRSHFGIFVSCIDCITILSIIITFLTIDHLKYKNYETFMKSNTFIRDFTLHLTDIKIPRKSIQEEFGKLIEFFISVKTKEDPKNEDFVFLPISGRPELAKYRDYRKKLKSNDTNFFIYDMVYPVLTSDKLSTILKINKIQSEVNELKKKIDEIENKKTPRVINTNIKVSDDEQNTNNNVTKYNRDYEKQLELSQQYKEQRDEKKKQIQKLKRIVQKEDNSKDIEELYITFRNYNIAHFFFQLYNKSKCERCRAKACCRNSFGHLYYKNKWLNLKFARDEPSNIKWENLTYNPCKKCCRSCFSFFLGILIMIITLIIIIFCKYFEQELNEEFNTNINCNYFIDDNANSHIIAEYTDNIPKKERVYSYCYCYNAISVTQIFKTDIETQSLPNRPDIKPCQDFVPTFLKYTAISTGLVVVIPIINAIVVIILKCLTSFEKNKTLSKDMSGNMWKMFIIQFINSGLLMLIVNMKISIIHDTIKNFPFLTGSFTDMDIGWYNKVGNVILFSMILNIITPHIASILFMFLKYVLRCCDSGCSCGKDRTRKKFKRDYMSLYTGPIFDIDCRYAATLSSFYVTIIYGSGMPLLYVCFFIYLFITFLVDKCLTLKYYKIPPKFDLHINNMFINFSGFAILVHFLVSIWIYGNPTWFIDNVNQQLDGGLFEQIKNRITIMPCAIMIIFGFLILLIKIIKGCGSCCCCCCRCCRKKEEDDKDEELDDELNTSTKSVDIHKIENEHFKERNNKQKRMTQQKTLNASRLGNDEDSIVKDLNTNVEITLATPMKALIKFYTIKKIEYFQSLKNNNKTKGTERYKENLHSCLKYIKKFILYRMEKEGVDVDIELLKNNFDEELENLNDKIDIGLKPILKCDTSYNLAFVPEFESAAYYEYLKNLASKSDTPSK